MNKSKLMKTNNVYLKMKGADVFSFTLNKVPEFIKNLDQFVGKEHDYYLLYKANAFMLKHIIRKSGIKKNKFPLNINKYGNLSSASIPLLIVSEINQIMIKEIKLLSCIGLELVSHGMQCHLKVI